MKTIPIHDVKLDNLLLRLVKRGNVFIGLIFEGPAEKLRIEGASQDDTWRQLHDEAARMNPMYFGFDGARSRFLKFFPDGFHSDHYARMERDYKVTAKAQLDATAPVEQAATGSGLGEAVLAAFRDTNLLSRFEKPRMKEVLRGSAADAFVRAAARFTLGEGATALLGMEAALKPYRIATWPAVTYLAFLWWPEEHMFLKPDTTRDFAHRVGHSFAHDYDARLDIAVYESLRDLASRTARELAELKPRDGIDVQSFIWVIGNYKEADAIQATP